MKEQFERNDAEAAANTPAKFARLAKAKAETDKSVKVIKAAGVGIQPSRRRLCICSE